MTLFLNKSEKSTEDAAQCKGPGFILSAQRKIKHTFSLSLCPLIPPLASCLSFPCSGHLSYHHLFSGAFHPTVQSLGSRLLMPTQTALTQTDAVWPVCQFPRECLDLCLAWLPFQYHQRHSRVWNSVPIPQSWGLFWFSSCFLPISVSLWALVFTEHQLHYGSPFATHCHCCAQGLHLSCPGIGCQLVLHGDARDPSQNPTLLCQSALTQSFQPKRTLSWQLWPFEVCPLPVTPTWWVLGIPNDWGAVLPTAPVPSDSSPCPRASQRGKEPSHHLESAFCFSEVTACFLDIFTLR